MECWNVSYNGMVGKIMECGMLGSVMERNENKSHGMESQDMS